MYITAQYPFCSQAVLHALCVLSSGNRFMQQGKASLHNFDCILRSKWSMLMQQPKQWIYIQNHQQSPRARIFLTTGLHWRLVSWTDSRATSHTLRLFGLIQYILADRVMCHKTMQAGGWWQHCIWLQELANVYAASGASVVHSVWWLVQGTDSHVH